MIVNEINIKTNELFYSLLQDKNNYDIATQECIKNTVADLLNNKTNNNHPGMLLGKIQSGKTRTFIGVTGLAFDNSFDVTIILTKGTKALAYQTYERLKKEFNVFVEDDYLQIFDIMNLPDNLALYELEQKLIFIVKKETNNLKRLEKALNETYPELKNKRTLIIDDEADYASIGFKKTDKEIYEINKIAGQIDALRQTINNSSFLQVTATPYSLYLQPDSNIELSGDTFKPIKPAFTHLVPHGSNYVGGEYYFQESQDDASIAFHLHNLIDDDELQILKKPDRRKFKVEEALNSNRVKSLRNAIVNFIVGGIIRRQQNDYRMLRKLKYSFIIHTEQRQSSHQWQEEIVIAIIDQLTIEANKNPLYFKRLVKDAYDRLNQSLNILGINVPLLDDVQYLARESLFRGHVMVTKVNSEKDVNELLDDTGQLKLRVPFNIFIGGQILDRGITISNLIGFYYGRNPIQYQQDTVLQHSRMFGYRPIEDLAVTRFYTTSNLYQVMSKINDFDSTLRNAITNQNNSVIFIQKDNENNIIPCNPNKIILSKLTSLNAYKRLLPIGIQTYSKTKLRKTINEIDEKVNFLISDNQEEMIDLEDASKIISLINSTFDPVKGEEWDVKSFLSSMEYLSRNAAKNQDKVWLIIRKNRNINRIRESSGRYEDAPDTPKGENSELQIAKKLAQDIPALILLRETGYEEKGWKGSPFWWPVLVAPASIPPVVFAKETIDK